MHSRLPQVEGGDLCVRHLEGPCGAHPALVASHLDLEAWRRACACWMDEVGRKPNYDLVAWAAARAGAPARALHVADLAARRFGADPAFVEEARLMHELLGE